MPKTVERKYTGDPEAFHAFWMGVSFWSMHTSTGFENAIVHFTKAIEKDPEFALAYAYLADTYGHDGMLTKVISKREAWQKARSAAAKALEIDPDSPEALAAMALIRNKEGRQREGFELIKRAVRLKPNHPHARHRLARMYANLGDIESAVKHARIALDQDPKSAYLNLFYAEMLYFAERYELGA